MDPLTPNTAAILDYLAANYDTNTNSDDLNLLNSVNDNMSFPGMPGMPAAAPSIPQMPFQTLNKGMPNSLPPSAFNMPLPGRDTPEATPESTKSTSNSPKQAKAAEDADGSDSDALVAITDTTARRKSVTGAGQGAQNKRKAGHTHKVEQVSDEDDGERLRHACQGIIGLTCRLGIR
jgi:AP-1-like factor